MRTDIWLNLPVSDLARSVAFYETLGFTRSQGLGNSETSACFMVGEKKMVLMLFARHVFAGFVGGNVADPNEGSAVLISLGASSRDEVDDIAQRAEDAGGHVFGKPSPAGERMYGCGLCDPDDHRWNVLFMG